MTKFLIVMLVSFLTASLSQSRVCVCMSEGAVFPSAEQSPIVLRGQ